MEALIDYLEKTEIPVLSEAFKICKEMKSDINGHFNAMMRLGSECDHITEFGVRFGVSTVCWLQAKPKRLVCYDIKPKKTIPMLQALAVPETQFEFIKGDTLRVEIEPTDLLFIDSYHTYDHLKEELRLHADKVRKYILMHDTESCGTVGGHKSGARGLKPAIKEFLEEKKDEWHQLEHHTHCNGMTVFARK